MSEMERHRGIIKRLSTKENARDVFDELVENGEIEPKWCEVEGLDVQYIDSDKYMVVNGSIFDVSDAPDEDDAYDDVNEAVRINDTDYRVHAYFYNGGAGFGEMLEESIPKADEEYEKSGKSQKEIDGVIEKELDDIMEDLIIGHNFEYARKALLEWHNKFRG